METFYLIDFENVHNDGIANIESITKEEHVHIFSTQNATNIRQDIFWLNGDIKSHLVPVRKQSLDIDRKSTRLNSSHPSSSRMPSSA